MAFSQEMIEQVGAWCFRSPEVASERERAWRLFFAEDDPRPAKYWIGGDDRIGRERRFLGWFMFDYTLPDGEKPAEAAVKRLYSGGVQAEALKAVSGARYLFAVASRIDRRSVYLSLEDESFEVHSPAWAANLRQYQGVVAHIVPVRHGYWLPAPGWFVWPVSIGPGMRANLNCRWTPSAWRGTSRAGSITRRSRRHRGRRTITWRQPSLECASGLGKGASRSWTCRLTYGRPLCKGT